MVTPSPDLPRHPRAINDPLLTHAQQEAWSQDGDVRGLRTWLAVLDAAISGLERTAWQARALADQTRELWRNVGRGSGQVAEDYRALADEARRWPSRLKRLSSTAWMLTKVTASYRLWGTRSAWLTKSELPAAREALHRKNATRFLKTSLRHGGAFLKLGQLLSARPDLLPTAWIDTLAQLQDDASPEAYDAIEQVLIDELGDHPDNLFASFEMEPVACASIGQVHRATLHDGTQVAVKIQRPGLDEVIALDMTTLKLFLESIRSLLPPTDLDTIAGEIERAILSELDYREEARWMKHARTLLENNEGIGVPQTVDALCTKRVLTSEFVVGDKLTNRLEALQAQGDHQGLSQILNRLLDAYFCQVLRGGFFQADPHPGNFLVTPNGTVVVLDFGCTMVLPEAFHRGYMRVLQAAIVGARDVIGKTLEELGFQTRSGKPDTLLAFADGLLSEIRDGINKAQEGGVNWPSKEEFMARAAHIMEAAQNDPVDKLPAEFVMLARVFSTLGGLFSHYRPDLDVAGILVPYLTQPIEFGVYAA